MSIDYEAVDAEFEKMKRIDLQELRRLATDVLTIEKSGNKWKTGVPDHDEQLAKRHEIELAQAQIALRDALRNPSTIVELLDRLQAAEKVCMAVEQKVKIFDCKGIQDKCDAKDSEYEFDCCEYRWICELLWALAEWKEEQ